MNPPRAIEDRAPDTRIQAQRFIKSTNFRLARRSEIWLASIMSTIIRLINPACPYREGSWSGPQWALAWVGLRGFRRKSTLSRGVIFRPTTSRKVRSIVKALGPPPGSLLCMSADGKDNQSLRYPKAYSGVALTTKTHRRIHSRPTPCAFAIENPKDESRRAMRVFWERLGARPHLSSGTRVP